MVKTAITATSDRAEHLQRGQAVQSQDSFPLQSEDSIDLTICIRGTEILKDARLKERLKGLDGREGEYNTTLEYKWFRHIDLLQY